MRSSMLAMRLAVLGLLGSGLTGCQTIAVGDTVDLTFDFRPGVSNELHTPYVAGADFRLYTLGPDAEDLVGWTLFSEDPGVLRIDSTVDGSADATVVGEGPARLHVRDADGQDAYEVVVAAHQANRADLIAHGPLIIGRSDLQPEDTSRVHVVTGGQATFLIHWYQGDTRLHGHGALSTVSDGDIEVEPRRSFLFEDREWVSFTPLTDGEHRVDLLANGQPVRTITVVGVDPDSVADVELYGQDESRAGAGTLLTVLAQAYDAVGNPVYGAEPAWDLNGGREEGLGDLFRYEYEPGSVSELCAIYRGHEVVTEIQGTEGWVDSTNNIGCAVGHVSPASAALPLGLLAVSLLLIGRRRVR